MSDKTKIEWANHTGGPFFGCSPVSPGCLNCYAWELAEARLEHLFRRAYKNAGFADWDTRPVWGDKATRVLSKGFWVDAVRINKMHAARGTRGRWFPSMIDWLDEMPGGIIDLDGKKLDPAAVLADFLKLIHDTPSLDWLLLTKRPENFLSRLHDVIAWCPEEWDGDDCPHWVHWLQDWFLEGTAPANVVIGASMENQSRVIERMGHLLMIPALTRFISAEPLLGPLNLWPGSTMGRNFQREGSTMPHDSGIHWVIVGGESGHKARPCNVEWIRDIVRQCKAAGVPCFVKQLGSKSVEEPFKRYTLTHPKGGDVEEWPFDLKVREYPTALRPAQS